MKIGVDCLEGLEPVKFKFCFTQVVAVREFIPPAVLGGGAKRGLEFFISGISEPFFLEGWTMEKWDALTRSIAIQLGGIPNGSVVSPKS